MVLAILITAVLAFAGGYWFCAINPPQSLKDKLKSKL